MFAVQICDRNREMAVPVAERIRLLAALVDGELDFEPRLDIAQIDELKVSKSSRSATSSPKAFR